jgi:two-component system, chemotaxis family, chemotaxis protein CheY
MTPQTERRKGALLIVDDDEHMRRLLASLARSAGFHRVIQERDVGGALGAIDFHPLCAAVVDISLGTASGVESISAIRSHRREGMRGTPVVALSGNPTPSRVAQAMMAGADTFISKPLSADKFQRHLKAAMRRPGPAGEAVNLDAFGRSPLEI